MNWHPLDEEGEYKVEDDTVIATLTRFTKTKTVEDPDIPALYEFADPEMVADGIPRLTEEYGRRCEEYAEWVAQGWWPRPVTVETRHLMVHHKESGLTFTASLEVKGALDVATEAVRKIQARRQPSFMVRHG